MEMDLVELMNCFPQFTIGRLYTISRAVDECDLMGLQSDVEYEAECEASGVESGCIIRESQEQASDSKVYLYFPH
jgi:hypothetical protein